MAFNLKKFLGGSDISSEDEYYTLSVEDNVVYVYKKINYTHDIEDSDNFGNIYQIKIKNLK